MYRFLKQLVRFSKNNLLVLSFSIIILTLLISLIVYETSVPAVTDTAVTRDISDILHEPPDEQVRNLVNEKKRLHVHNQFPEKLLTLPLSLIKTETRGENAPYAVIRHNNTGKDYFLKTGDIILNATVVKIDTESVTIRKELAEQVLTIGQQPVFRIETEDKGNKQITPPYSPEEIAEMSNYDHDIQEVMSLMAQIDFAPGPPSNETSGVLVTRIRKDSIFEKIGLEVDDMVLSIDGKRIESLDDSLEIYESLRTSSEGSILIIRNNREETLSYQQEYL